ncbi:uncharacterized protein LOC127787853 isoform X1 [Diospyros lotus]|uniref:uncharacterized protein LOC127787853 isoform X1 n=1 Tax=Diospyros lotus TaxID=55363 RepID=UPI00225BF40D|nr:uncharacterized protein LOC127787853 isoform X1 [Diospyros lotus]
MHPTQPRMASADAAVSRSIAYAAATDLTPELVAKLCDFWRREGGSLPVDERRNTILHFLGMHGNTAVLKELDDKRLILPSQDLWKANHRGDTPIHEAVRFGNDEFVQKMLELDMNLVSTRNLKGETPLYVAAKYGKETTFNLLKSRSCSDRELVRADGRTVLHAAVNEEYYSLAIKILTLKPELASARDEKGTTALYLLALKPSSFRSGSSYTLRNLGCWSFVPLQLVAILIYICLPTVIGYEKFDSTGEEQSRNQLPTTLKPSLRLKLITAFRGFIAVFPWLRKCDQAKQRHACAMKLVKMLMDLEDDWSNYTGQRNPLIDAARNGIIELVKAILDKFPFAAYTLDGDGKNIVHIAVEQKDRVLYDYLTSIPAHKDMLADIDKHGNTVLHLATNVGSSPGMLLNQMTWDVCWFKRIFYDSLPHFLQYKNAEGKTPKEMFKENHSTLQQSAAQAIKDMNNGLMLVSTLICTENYAALFTLPGGFGQEKKDPKTYGKPVLLSKEETKSELTHFMWYLLLSLFSFLISMTSMLSIQLSRFRSSDFNIALPLRFIVAMTALFSSALFTCLASLHAFKLDRLEFNKNWLFGPGLCGMALLYSDTISITVIYMYYALRYSSRNKGQEILDLLI